MWSRDVRAILCAGILTGCSAVTLESGAQQVRIVTNEPQGCEYLGEVTGSQGDFFTGAFTSNANLETGARNDLKNQANKLGANTVQMLTNRAGQTGSMGRGVAAWSRQTSPIQEWRTSALLPSEINAERRVMRASIGEASSPMPLGHARRSGGDAW